VQGENSGGEPGAAQAELAQDEPKQNGVSVCNATFTV
jgi:hypothetical protein